MSDRPTAPHACIDMILPADLRSSEPEYPAHAMRAILVKGKKWAAGTTLRIAFLEGTQAQKDFVVQIAEEWLEHANLHFEWITSGTSDIRISFDPYLGAWSYLGTDARSIPQHSATMNLGWLDAPVVLHEFGHALGLGHEHQNPDGGLKWNEAEVIAALSGPPNNWDTATIKHNVLNHYTEDQVNGTAFDPDSIMLYAFPDSWVASGKGTKENPGLSDVDRAFIASAMAYPGIDDVTDVVELEVTRKHSSQGTIATAGEVDWFRFDVEANEGGVYKIHTRGRTDTLLSVYGPGNRTAFIAEDNDSGYRTSSKLVLDLAPGTYYAAVRLVDEAATGDYWIEVTSR